METTRDDIRECIADRLDGNAEWRESVAERYPDDQRNAKAAHAMRACAAYVRELPADDPRLVELDSMSWGYTPFMFDREVDLEEENQLWGRIGFDDSCDASDHLDMILEFYREKSTDSPDETTDIDRLPEDEVDDTTNTHSTVNRDSSRAVALELGDTRTKVTKAYREVLTDLFIAEHVIVKMAIEDGIDLSDLIEARRTLLARAE